MFDDLILSYHGNYMAAPVLGDETGLNLVLASVPGGYLIYFDNWTENLWHGTDVFEAVERFSELRP